MQSVLALPANSHHAHELQSLVLTPTAHATHAVMESTVLIFPEGQFVSTNVLFLLIVGSSTLDTVCSPADYDPGS